MFVGWLGLPLDYRTAHFVQFLLTAGILYLTYRSLTLLVSPVAARLSTWLAVHFFSITIQVDYVHYTSEGLSLLLCAFLLQGIIHLHVGKPSSSVRLLGLGVAAGLVPFAKLQAVPVAFFLSLILALTLIKRRYKSALSHLPGFVAGGLLPFGLILFYCYSQGLLSDFYRFYLEANLSYAAIYQIPDRTWVELLADAWKSFRSASDLMSLIIVPALPLTLVALWASFRTQSLTYFVFLLSYWAVSLYVVVKPGSFFHHHLLFLVPPSVLLTGMSLETINQRISRFGQAFFMAGSMVVTLYLGYAQYQHHRVVNPYLAAFPARWKLPQNELIRSVKLYSQPDEKIAVWGWQGSLYIASQQAQATRDNHIQRCAWPSYLQNYYLERYLKDLQRNRPPVLLDLGLNYFGKTQFYIEEFPMLASYIKQNYLPVSHDSIRVFVRKDRLEWMTSRAR